MKKETMPLQSWSYPLILALLGIVLWIGNISPSLKAGLAAETLLFLGYLMVFSRGKRTTSSGAKLISMFPAHLLLLLVILLLPSFSIRLIFAWMVVPVATIGYHFIASRSLFSDGASKSILSGLYCIIWADLFFLLERAIALGRGLTDNEEIVVMAVFCVIGAIFLSIGVYRHLRTNIFGE